MKQKPVMILLWLMLLQSVLVITAFSAVPPEGWKALRGNLYINEKTLTHLNDNTVSAWIYLIPRKGSDTYNAAGKQLRTMKKNSKDLEYIGYLTETDCGKSLYRKISTVFFRDDRNIIASSHRSHADWKEIENDSIFYDVYQTVCGKDQIAIRSDTEKD